MEIFLLAFATGFGAAVAVSIISLLRNPETKITTTSQYRDGFLDGFSDAKRADRLGVTNLSAEFFLARRLAVEGDPWQV